MITGGGSALELQHVHLPAQHQPAAKEQNADMYDKSEENQTNIDTNAPKYDDPLFGSGLPNEPGQTDGGIIAIDGDGDAKDKGHQYLKKAKSSAAGVMDMSDAKRQQRRDLMSHNTFDLGSAPFEKMNHHQMLQRPTTTIRIDDEQHHMDFSNGE